MFILFLCFCLCVSGCVYFFYFFPFFLFVFFLMFLCFLRFSVHFFARPFESSVHSFVIYLFHSLFSNYPKMFWSIYQF